MGKSTIQDLAATLIQRRDMGKKEASQFVNEMFFVIQKALDQDKLVKVKGLGTFKIIDVDDRESVDVNTGDRVLIEGHGKITFTPDSLMKELVNKPFSQFETVVLKDGVDFEDAEPKEAEDTPLPEEAPQTESPQTAPPQTESPLAETAPTDKAEPVENPSEAPLVDFVTEEEPAPQPLMEEQPETEPIEEEEQEESLEELTTIGRWKKTLASHQKELTAALVACGLCFLFGYLVGVSTLPEVWTPEDAYRQAKTVEQIMQEPEEPVQPEPQTAQVQPEPEQQPAQVQPQPEPKVEDATKEEPKAVEPAEPVNEDLDKYAKMDVRIRTGAYRIVGTDRVYTVKSGDNLKKISRFFFGPDMDCYVEVYNGLNANSELKAGQKINIPKLVHKKQLGNKK